MTELNNTAESKARRKEIERKTRRDLITSIALHFFTEKGYDNTSVGDIARDAGYTKKTLYNYFDSKDDLFAAVLAKVYETMFDTLDAFLKQPGASFDFQTLGDAYLAFVEQYSDQAALIDSGKCIIINRTIIEKEENGQELTESEIEFKNNETRAGMLMIDVIRETMRTSGVDEKVDPAKIVKVLGVLNLVISEIIRRGKATQQSNDEIRENLTILFTIITKGVKYYSA
ncbi:MAG: TetR/AcrR family transcriptional regulator [Candidatus Odinarchaeota archaeon]